MAADVSTTSAVYDSLAPKWRMIDDLMGGTDAMRRAGKAYLQPHPKEKDTDYQRRLARATLASYFSDSIDNYVGRIFAKQVSLQEDVPNKISNWFENIDQQGNHGNVFFVNVATTAISKGLVWVLIDFPNNTGAKTLADEKGSRPYATFYRPEAVLFTRINKLGEITEARIFETVTEQRGEFEEATVEQIRRLILTTDGKVKYQLWRKPENNTEWAIFEEGDMSIDEIPLVPLYTNLKGSQYSPPPLLDLAYLCVKHWQQQSEQDNVAEVARFPILAASGVDPEKAEKLMIGPQVMLAGDKDTKFYYVEHSGAAIGAGRAELERLEDQIAMKGVRPLTRTRTANGATATQIDSEDRLVKSAAQIWSDNIKDAIEKCLGLMAKWAGLGEDKGGSVSLEGDFDTVTGESFAQVLQMRQAQDLSRQTLYTEAQRRDILSDDFDPAQEQIRLEEEGLGEGGNGKTFDEKVKDDEDTADADEAA